MKMNEFLKFIVKSMDLNYENENYLFGFIDALNSFGNTATVEEFDYPFLVILYKKLKEEGKL